MVNKKPFKSDIQKNLEAAGIDKINIGWRSFNLIFINELKDEDGDAIDGHVTTTPANIKIEQMLDEEGVRETLLHEIIHVIAMLVGFDDSEEDDGKSITIENEALVTRFTRGMMLAMNLNPQLFRILYNYE